MVFRMRKMVFFLVLLTLGLLVAVPGLCQTLTLDAIYATVDIPGSYTLLTPQSMELSQDFLKSRGTTVDVMLQSFQAEGILLQAWSPDGSACLQISALKDVDAQDYFDIDQQSVATRGAYRKGHLSGEAYQALGISYDSAEWKKTSAYGRFLMLKYVQRIGGKVDHRGYARRTIRNGYTITLDYQVYGRDLATKDRKALDSVMETFKFTEVLPIPGDIMSRVKLTQAPPEQTNTATFKVAGVTASKAEVTGSLLGMSDTKPILVKDTANKAGEFSLSFTMPKEGTYSMGLTVSVNGEVTEEVTGLPPITYDKTMLPVNFDEEFPAELTSDKLVISGTSAQGVTVQCIVNSKNDTKKVGANKEFSFSIDTKEEGAYSITLVFSKKGLTDQRFSFIATREWSETEKEEKVRAEAIKPAHTVLESKIKGYTGRIMGYSAYVTGYAKSSDGWVVYMAMRKTGGKYRDMIVVTTKEEPTFAVDTQVKMYGTCTGMYEVQSESGSGEYPSFDLLFWDE